MEVTRVGLLAAALAITLAPAACRGLDDPLPIQTRDQARPATAARLAFTMHSAGVSEPDRATAFASEAQGWINWTALDDPPLVIGTVAIDHMQLRAGTQVLADLGPGQWPVMARRSEAGSLEALWTGEDTPREIESLTRLLFAELQGRPTGDPDREPGLTGEDALDLTDADPSQEATPLGLLLTRHHHWALLGHQLVFRLRRGAARDRGDIVGITAAIADEDGPTLVVSVLRSRAALLGEQQLVSTTLLFARRSAQILVADDDLSAQIEALSARSPIALVEVPQGEVDMAALRRNAEPWPDVLARLRDEGDTVEANTIPRAAAHLVADDACVAALETILDRDDDTRHDGEPGSDQARARMFAALAECGTTRCQQALVQALTRNDPQPALRSALLRVRAPERALVDRMLTLTLAGDEALAPIAGVMLARADPSDAAPWLARLLADMERCPAALEPWFELLGNAGAPMSEPTLQACFDTDLPAPRQAGAARAMRRIPGAGVDATLVHQAATHEDPSVRLASLRALNLRELRGDALAPLTKASLGDWGTPALDALLDVLEHAPDQPAREALLTTLERSSDDDVAARARALQAR